MFRKNYFTFLLATALFLVGGTAVFSQNAPIAGRVEMTNADGTKTPVAGALVEVFRMDQKVKLPTDKTDKKGNFAFAGITLGGRYVLAVSGAGIAPNFIPNVSPGSDNLVIPVTAGDGKRFTEEEIKQQLSSGTNTTTTTTTKTPTKAELEEAKQREEQIKKQNEENERIKKSNEIIITAQKEGNAAFEQKNYDLAVAKYEEGYNAAPTFVPAASVFLNNMALSLIKRAEVNYNAKRNEDRTAAAELVKTDMVKSIEASNKTLEMLKTATPRDEKQKTDFEKRKADALKNRKDAYYLLVKAGLERTKNKETIAAYEEYFAAETVPADKMKSQLAFADILLDLQENDLALAQYEKILTESPDNLDAMAGAGFTLVNIAYTNNEDKAKFQLAVNYLQKFVDKAPETNPRKADAKSAIDTIKKDYKISPKK